MRSMHPSLAPTQTRMSSSRPSRAFRGKSGSAISARVIPTRSTAPSDSTRSAWTGSTMRLAWKMGTPGTAALIAAASGTYTPIGNAMFGTTAACRAAVWAAPPTTERKSRSREAAGDLGHVLGRQATGGHLVARDTRADGPVAPDLTAHLAEHLEPEAHPV